MQRNYVLGVLVAVLVIGGFMWYVTRNPSSPVSLAGESQSTTTPSIASSTPPVSSVPSKPAGPFTFSLVRGDTVASWSFKGAYTGNAELEQKARAEIARLSAMFGTGKFTDYELYVSIANQYDLLGDGAQEFAYLKKALSIDAEHTGLAWNNVGHLLSKLGAKFTARVAFGHAVAVQPIPQYEQDLANSL